MEWRDRIFSPPSTDDPHYLNFSPYEPKVHEPVRQAMMSDARKLEQEEEEVISNYKIYILNIHSRNINVMSYCFYYFRFGVETVSH